MVKELSEQERIYFFYFEWRYEWSDQNYKIIGRFRCINWCSYLNSIAWNKKEEGGFLGALLAPLTSLLVPPVISSAVKQISGRGVRRARRWNMDNKF